MKELKKLLVLLFIGIVMCEDPFSLLGIPTLNPSSLFSSDSVNQQNERMKRPPNFTQQKNMFNTNDYSFIQNTIKKTKNNNGNKKKLVLAKVNVLKMLESAGITSEDGIQTASRFLLVNNPNIRALGGVFDKNQFSGIPTNEQISMNQEDRLFQKIKSTANLYFAVNLQNPNYDVYGIQEIISNKYFGWRSFRVLMVNRNSNSGNNNYYLTVCYPLDDMLCPFCIQNSEDCSSQVMKKYIYNYDLSLD